MRCERMGCTNRVECASIEVSLEGWSLKCLHKLVNSLSVSLIVFCRLRMSYMSVVCMSYADTRSAVCIACLVDMRYVSPFYSLYRLSDKMGVFHIFRT